MTVKEEVTNTKLGLDVGQVMTWSLVGWRAGRDEAVVSWIESKRKVDVDDSLSWISGVGITPPQIDGLFPRTILSGVRVDVGTSRAYNEMWQATLFTALHQHLEVKCVLVLPCLSMIRVDTINGAYGLWPRRWHNTQGPAWPYFVPCATRLKKCTKFALEIVHQS